MRSNEAFLFWTAASGVRAAVREGRVDEEALDDLSLAAEMSAWPLLRLRISELTPPPPSFATLIRPVNLWR